MLLILRSFSVPKARQNPPQRGRARAKSRFQIANPKESARQTHRGRAATENRFEIEDLIERLEESRIAAAKVKSQRNERSQEVVENKGKCFPHTLQSQEVFENKGVIFVKPRGC